jgi:hypothetical protein
MAPAEEVEWMGRWRMGLLVSLVALLVTIPMVVLATTGGGGGNADRQRFKFRTGVISTSSKVWKDVPGLGVLVCAIREVSATASVNLSGAPALFRVQIDSGAVFQPGPARFNPPRSGVQSFSYTFVDSAGTFEGSDSHAIILQWRSLTGGSVSMTRGDINLIFQTGTCP